MSKYILNRETSKIELHFDKAEYLALTDTQKQEIKSNFLWSRTAGAWVSRSTRDHYWALKVAKKLGLENAGSEGERLAYAEELERKAERAEARADRYETYAANAATRGASMQAELNSHRGDIAFFTQPNINSSAGRTFKNRRERIFAKYERGMDEYRKSDYYRERAVTAQKTADMKQLKDPVYLHNRIKEQNATIKKLQENIVSHEDKIYRISQGEVINGYFTREPIKIETLEKALSETLDKMEYELDKLAFFKNCLDEIGGIQYSREDIKPGYIVKIKHSGRCEIISAGPVNVKYKILEGGAAGTVLTDPYAAIMEILVKKESPKVINPYQIGNILCRYSMAGNYIVKAYQIIKTTATSVKIQQIAVEKGIPVPGQFVSDKAVLRKVVKSKFSDFIGIYEGDRQLHKYSPAGTVTA